MRITEEEKEEVISMYKTGNYYINEIAEWIGILFTSARKIINNYERKEKEQWRESHIGKMAN